MEEGERGFEGGSGIRGEGGREREEGEGSLHLPAVKGASRSVHWLCFPFSYPHQSKP